MIKLYFIALGLTMAGCSNTGFTSSGITNSRDKHKDNKSTDDNETDTNGNSPGIDDETIDQDGIIDGEDDDDKNPGLGEDGTTCTTMPLGGKAPESKTSGTQVKNTIYHESVAVDPGKTGNDPSSTYGATPYPLSPDDKLAKTVFKHQRAELKDLISKGVTEIEYVVFAHQFQNGLDKIKVTIKAGGEQLSDTSNVNIYSAYAYASIRNMKMSGDDVVGDLELKSFNYDPKGTGPLFDIMRSTPVSVQDATDIVGPASKAAEPRVAKKGLSLKGLEVTIEISADTYDSVQYRAIRTNLWSSERVEVDLCKS